MPESELSIEQARLAGPEFLGRAYPKPTPLHKSPEVQSAARLVERKTGEAFSGGAEGAHERIQSYLNRLKDAVYNPNQEIRGRSIDLLKRSLHEQFVIKPDDVPEGYFDSIKQRHRQEGHGDIEIPEDYRRDEVNTLVGDQVRSLDNWVDYLTSDDATYPDWLKYYTLRSVVSMGRYDKKRKTFSKREKGTVSPFPDLNREALAIILGDLEKQENHIKQKTEQKPVYEFTKRYDISDEAKADYKKQLENKNFSKLYALAIEEFKPISEELLRTTEGEWINYPKGSDPKQFSETLALHGTGWCIRGEDTARRYLERSDLEVFYSLDANGQPTVPRVVIVSDNDRISEVRGVAEEENLDHHIGDIVKERLASHPDGKNFEKKFTDMKQLTAIESKSKNGEPLTKEDLTFLYELDSAIEGFGYQDDPRIKELRGKRNIQEDMLTIFDCGKDQIATTADGITDQTKAYVGKLEPGIFDKLKHIEHAYTSFPESKIRMQTIDIEEKSPDTLEQQLEQEGMQIPRWAKDMLHHPDFQKNARRDLKQIDLVRLTVADLGLPGNPTTEQVYKRAKELGLDLCPPEVGPHLRLEDKNQSMGEWNYIAMEPIVDSDGRPLVFRLERIGDGLWLHDNWAHPGPEWNPGDEFVFRLSK